MNTLLINLLYYDDCGIENLIYSIPSKQMDEAKSCVQQALNRLNNADASDCRTIEDFCEEEFTTAGIPFSVVEYDSMELDMT